MKSREHQEAALSGLARAEESLSASTELFQSGHYNDCISRLYYTLFYLASAAIHSQGQTVKTHKSVGTHFSRSFIKTKVFPAEMGVLFHKLGKMRSTADYDLKVVYEQEDVEDLIPLVVDFLHTIRTYLTNKPVE